MDRVIILKDILNIEFMSEELDIVLSCRESADEKWQTVTGRMLDDKLLRWMDCPVIALKFEIGKPLKIAVEGVPHGWGV